MSEGKTIKDLRTALFEALQGVKDGSLTLDRARAVNEISKTLIDSAKVEVDFLRVTGGIESEFIPETDTDQPKKLPSSGTNGTTVHRLR